MPNSPPRRPPRLRAWLLALLAAPLAACNPDASGGSPDGGDGPWTGPLYVFVSTVTGKVHVVDTRNGAIRLTVPLTTGSVHGVGPDENKRVLYGPDFGRNRIVRYQLAPDLRSAQMDGEWPISDPPTFLTLAPDGATVATGAADPNLGSQGIVSGHVALLDVAASRIVNQFQFMTPGRISFDPTSRYAYAAQGQREIPVLDVRSVQVVDLWTNHAFDDWKEMGGGSPHGAVRKRDGMYCVANGLLQSTTCIDPENSDDQIILRTPGELPHDLGFDDFTGRLWVQTQGDLPRPGNEEQNVHIPCFIHVYDLETREEVTPRFNWTYGVWHVAIGPDARAYVTASYGTLIVYDTKTFQKLAEWKLQDGAQPLLTMNFFRGL